MTYPTMDREGDIWQSANALMIVIYKDAPQVRYYVPILPVTLAPVAPRRFPHEDDLIADYRTPIWHEDTCTS